MDEEEAVVGALTIDPECGIIDLDDPQQFNKRCFFENDMSLALYYLFEEGKVKKYHEAEY